MSKFFSNKKNRNIRRSFSKSDLVHRVPNLIEIQKSSYEKQFLQKHVDKNLRKNKGLQSVLSSIFPIKDSSGSYILEFLGYSLGDILHDVDECKENGYSYVMPLKISVRMILWEKNLDGGEDKVLVTDEIKGIKDQEVFLCDVPVMTERGTFVINGIERVVISQMHRSPGVFFYHDDGKNNTSGKILYSARVIPYRGSWLDFEFDARDLVFFRIDKKRKLPVTSLLFAFGLEVKDIFEYFYEKIQFSFDSKSESWVTKFFCQEMYSKRLDFDLLEWPTGRLLVKAGEKISPRRANILRTEGVKEILVSSEYLYGKYLAEEIVDQDTGEVLFRLGEKITKDNLAVILSLKKYDIALLKFEGSDAYIRNTLFIDKNLTQEDALIEIFKLLRPGEQANKESGKAFLYNAFSNPERYDLSEVGRIKVNARVDIDRGMVGTDHVDTCLSIEDIKAIIKVLIKVKDGKENVDDIDHLGNRRVRSVGELVENQFRLGMVRIQKSIFERLSMVDVDDVMPNELINNKLLISTVREFFNTSQFSQFMDQTNPLSEITHKRRLSSLGPGGVNRDRVGFEVRDVHPTHYGRICPVETPEGQNIGLINSLATYAKVNQYGFIETPYRVVKDRYLLNEIVYLSAIDEGRYRIAQFDINFDQNNYILDDVVNCRTGGGNFVMSNAEEVDFVDLNPMQVVSVAAALIPFLENDDANRALMGSNMQRQAVPLVTPEAPVVGTGIEESVGFDSGSVVLAKNSGCVVSVDSNRIVVKSLEDKSLLPNLEIYKIKKFQKSNHNTCINQKPLVALGDVVEKGDILADGAATDKGEIALGRNMLVAFLSWNGYNFEDSIIISEKVIREDAFTSIHIEEFEVVARDTRLGPEEITRDVPNTGEESIKYLDESGIINIGAEVKSGDILVGKVTPKSETAITPEEKLLRAIFGEKASEVRDSSLYVPPGVSGTVVDVKIFSRRGMDKDERELSIEHRRIDELLKEQDDQRTIINNFTLARLKSLFIDSVSSKNTDYIVKGRVFTEEILQKMSLQDYWDVCVDDNSIMQSRDEIKKIYFDKNGELSSKIENKIKKIQKGDDVQQGTLKIVKIFIASKYKLQPGDKMSGRHGNKGVISKIVPEEDMPFLEDGTVIDIILNPLGIPSRMNVGQILETHLGFAAKGLALSIDQKLQQCREDVRNLPSLREFVSNIYEGTFLGNELSELNDQEFINFCRSSRKFLRFSTPVFDGAKVEDIKKMLTLGGMDSSGQVNLIDGRTGECFDRKITVGYKYILKLHHLVEDKIHARSIGPYSLVTQQPLGGKSHFGGQRFGEMECWALQAYGASYTLQEMLTVKSDDVFGRVKTYESIVKDNRDFDFGTPESFNVMIKELRSLCLNIDLE